ncbi:MAG: signal peptidase I [Bacteroidota bacterium]|nr:signal peptidase I [Bacteroidota bacterium]
MLDFLKNKYFKFGLWTVVFLLFVLWIGNWWLLLGVPVIFDYYISKIVNWTFWKKRDLKKKSKFIEWIDALVFAVIAASIIRMFFIEAYMIPTPSMEKSLLVGDYLFVSKYSYGPKLPNTPLSVPFTHHTMPGTKSTKPYLEWIKRPYNRLAGLTDVKRNDIVVFNFPAGDTVVVEQQASSYYSIIRQQASELKSVDNNKEDSVFSNEFYYSIARDMVRANYTITERPVDKRENYIKRCVAVPGDTIEVIHRQVYVNSEEQKHFEDMQYKYFVRTGGRTLNSKTLKDMGVSEDDMDDAATRSPEIFVYPFTNEMKNKVEKFRSVVQVEPIENKEFDNAPYIFPHDPDYSWTEDNFGPLYIPKKGVTVTIDTSNIAVYQRIIEAYEKNSLEIQGEDIIINGQKANSYTFQMNYYFMMGDNRHMSADSRFWGFVPEDHIVGKALFIWMSLDPDKSLFRGGIRFDRLFSLINHN